MCEFTPHVLVEQHPNPKCRSYHVTREVADGKHSWGFGTEDLYNFDFTEDPGEEAQELGARLMHIRGVVGGSIKQYELQIMIGDAFRWKDVGPLVLGEIVKTVYPEVVGQTLEVSTKIGYSYRVRPCSFGFMGEDDDGHRYRYVDAADHETVEVNFGAGRPSLDVERLLGTEALNTARSNETVEE